MTETVKKYRLYAGLAQSAPKGATYSFLPSHHKYLLVYADTPPEPYDRFVEQDENKERLLNREERAWLLRCKNEINSKYLRENENNIASAMLQRLDAIEADLQEKKERIASKQGMPSAGNGTDN